MAYVYLHRRLDTDEVFYIGIGKTKNRHSSKYRRNKYWNNIVNKSGFESEIIYNDLTWESALNFEIFLIQLYGRKDLGTGVLCNMTDGGEGTLNRQHTDEAKLKISNANKGRKSSRKGSKISEDTRNKMINSKLGVANMKKRKVVINTETGKTYKGVKDAHKDFPNISLATLYSYLNGNKKNLTPLIYKCD